MTTYYFIRHAEKGYDGTRNPDLTYKGRQRAAHWAKILSDKNIDLIYCTKLIRTQQTAEPLLNKLGKDFRLYDLTDLYNEEFQKETKGKTTLVVGHQDTTPAFVNRILQQSKYSYIHGLNYGNLYKVQIDEQGNIKDQVESVDF
ncbi:MAG TPA: phosphoglycerate mutase family protein [Flavobacteriaceae bacterium]|nr:phosphoglycerate mutase family protein [Flavobacteriaceae bacterium]